MDKNKELEEKLIVMRNYLTILKKKDKINKESMKRVQELIDKYKLEIKRLIKENKVLKEKIRKYE